jgi:hypothetical protein
MGIRVRPAHDAHERYRLQARHASGDYCGNCR